MRIFFKKLFMQRIESIEKLKDLGNRVFKNNLTYHFYNDEHDYVIEIYKDNKKIYEFVCNRVHAKNFFDEAVEF